MAKKPINKEPRLFFPDSDGKYMSEYIPPPESRISFWLKERYLEFRILLGKDIYYWHIRHSYDPEFRKSSDVEFIRHVIKDHN